MIDKIRDICSGCDTLQLIQNKTLWLCPDCVFKRNHGGKTKEEVYKERHAKKVKELPKELPKIEPKQAIFAGLKKTFSIKKISNKRAEREKELSKVYKEIDKEREPICEGCGKSRPLSHSHLLSRHNRPDLMCAKENIRLHCFGEFGGPNKTCHERWSDMNCEEVVTMLDFRENLEYIKGVDINVYNKIVAKFEFENVKLF